MASLMERLEQDPEKAVAWRPDQEDPQVIVGKIVRFGTNTDFNGDPYLIVVIKDADEKMWAVHAFHFVLAQEIRKYKLKIDTEIGFKFLGKPEGKNYWAYRVESDAEIVMPGEAAAIPGDIDSTPPVPSTPVPSGVTNAVDDDIPF